MSIPLDAAYNRCRPVQPWSGSLSASRQRRATTRCSRDCKRDAGGGRREAGVRLDGTSAFLARIVRASRLSPPASSLASLFALLLLPAPLSSQAPPTPPSHPEVVNLTLKGVKSVKRSDLLSSIYTTASYCNSFLL